MIIITGLMTSIISIINIVYCLSYFQGCHGYIVSHSGKLEKLDHQTPMAAAMM